ncbi:carbohydrate ABC transporter permease [Peribacillus loiseleuriae]|uniref:carbohydrate ABC transporter permease n=1 Tax=Peribacillus loiseleuriae TaxID=1679170 RepID=UPI001FDFBABC|nr:sugar ABC transporter permease [Peribacillus loiseleuriae]
MEATTTVSKKELATTRRKKGWNQKTLAPYLFLSPFFIVFLIFMVYPIIESLYLSFTSTQGTSSEWIGLENFKNILTDGLFWKSLSNVFIILLVQVPLMLILGTLLAVILNSKFLKAKALFRLMIFLPVLIDLVTYSIVFSIIFHEQYGIMNYLLGVLHIDPIQWFSDPFWSKVLIIIAVTWRWTGYNTIILLAGLSAVDDSLYESAEVDGASKFTQFFKITIPMLKPILLFCGILSTIGTIQLFTEPSLLTNGGPNNATNTPVMYLYQFGFQSFQFGYASAAAYIITIIVGIISFFQIKLSKGGEI